jgi:acyl-CoA thioesterase-1
MKFVAVLVLVFAIGCSGREPQASSSTATPVTPAASAAPGTSDAAASHAGRIVFLGDSLTAGLGLATTESYPALIGARLKQLGYDYAVVNAGVSGDTSAGGLRRLDWSLEGDVRVLVVALGANDGLRGLPPAETKKNLAAILDRARERKIPVILAGMEAPPNNGPDYTKEFRAVYADLAAEYKVPFIPFLLQGVAGDPTLNQADGIHPNPRGAALVADLVWQQLQPLLQRPTDK